MANREDTRWVTQDGADFYIWRDSAMTDLQTVWSYRGRVFDLTDAQGARRACIDQLQLAGYTIEWPNPFGGTGE